jgi:hypothetical protein
VAADADTGMAMALSDGGQDYRLAATGGTSAGATTSGRSRWPDQVLADLDHGPHPSVGPSGPSAPTGPDQPSRILGGGCGRGPKRAYRPIMVLNSMIAPPAAGRC